jgi:hypothetical protein
MSERTTENCDWMDEMAVELALGLLEGHERASALAHVEQCGACQAEVASLTAVGERLLLLAPEVPPPAGFETRVLDRIASAPERLRALGRSGAGTSSRRPSGRQLVAAAAAVVVALLMIGGVAMRVMDDGPDVVAAEMKSSHGRTVGHVQLYKSSPPVVEIDVEEWKHMLQDEDKWPEGDWWLKVEDTAGDKDLYDLSLAVSPAKVTLDDEIDAAEITGLEIVDHNGRVWCTAEVST